MRKILLPVILITLLCTAAIIGVRPTFSDSTDDQINNLQSQINDLNSKLTASVNATRPLESQLTDMQNQITTIKAQVVQIVSDIAEKKKNIDLGYKDLAQKEQILNQTIRDLYIKSSYNSPLLTFLSTNNASQITQILAYQKAARDQDKEIITNIALTITDLQTKKLNLENEETRLTALKSTLDAQATKLDKIVEGAKAYQSQLSGQIAQLNAQQQALIAAKLASLNLPTTAYTTSGGCSSDLTNGKDPGFSPKLAAFSYGVPHGVGMNQYGAKGRADAGQGYHDILSFYYPNTQITSVSTGTSIHVSGANEYGESFDTNWDIETYVKHIYEMPTTWNAEALKAQAIAARSYALAYTNNGSSSICPSQSCQVVKTELNSQAWVDAVNATAGQVITSNGSPIKAWFSSTAGGFTRSSADVGWSSTPYTKTSLDASGSVNSFSDLQNNAYDKASPWFYCDWGGRSQYANTAWLKPEEMADIVNVVMLAKVDNSTTAHLNQTDKGIADTWDSDRVKQELKNRNMTPYNAVTSISANADFGSGRTTTVQVNGDAGSQSFSGTDFKNFFNLRAPANINIVSPLYNIEVK